MRRYETISILHPSLGEDEINTVVDTVTKIITDEKGTIIDLNKWGMKKLAYPIKKEIQGFYVYCDYAATPATVSEIERRFRIDDSVLKYLTIKTNDDITAEEIQTAIGETEARNAAAQEEAAAEEAETAEKEQVSAKTEKAPEDKTKETSEDKTEETSVDKAEEAPEDATEKPAAAETETETPKDETSE